MFLRPGNRPKGERKEKGKCEEGHRSRPAKNVGYWEHRCENAQTTPLDGRLPVENQATSFIKSAVGSSDPQTEGLGKHG
jgi:hypothetical protein